MAELAQDGGGAKGGKKRPKKGSSRIDMTPMVDLGFLLLTFFVLTSTFAKPKVMSLTYPAKEKDPTKINENAKVNNAITFLLTKDNRVFYYEGEFFAKTNDKGQPPTQLVETDFSSQGVRKLLADKNSFVMRAKVELDAKKAKGQLQDTTYIRLLNEKKADLKALKVLVKTDDKALTRNFIDMIDELFIANIGVIAPVDIMKSEQELIDEKIK